MEALRFAIDQFDLIEVSDSQFAEFIMRVCTPGENAHKLYFDEETMKRAMPTLVGKPILAKYNRFTRDAGTHEKDEVPIGFIPHEKDVYIETVDGKPWIVAKGKIWKIYAREMMDVLRRRQETEVSMEILSNLDRDENGKKILSDFVFAGVTVLGRNITPAIAGAKLKMLKFSEMEKALESETFAHRYSVLDFTIPEEVKGAAQRGLELSAENQVAGSAVNLAMARYLIREEAIDYEHARKMNSANRRFSDVNDETQPSERAIASLLWGGLEGRKWIGGIVAKMDELDNKDVNIFSEDPEVVVKTTPAETEVETFADPLTSEQSDLNPETEVLPDAVNEAVDAVDSTSEFSADEYLDPMAKVAFLIKDAEHFKDVIGSAKAIAGFMREDLHGVDFAAPKEEDAEKLSMAREGMSKQMMSLFAEIDEKEDDDDVVYMFNAFSRYAKVMFACHAIDMAKMAALEEFKASTIERDKFAKVEALLCSVNDDLSEEDVTNFRTFAKEMPMDQFDAFANTVKSKAYERAKSNPKSRKNTQKPVQTFAVWSSDVREKEKSGYVWEKTK